MGSRADALERGEALGDRARQTRRGEEGEDLSRKLEIRVRPQRSAAGEIAKSAAVAATSAIWRNDRRNHSAVSGVDIGSDIDVHAELVEHVGVDVSLRRASVGIDIDVRVDVRSAAGIDVDIDLRLKTGEWKSEGNSEQDGNWIRVVRGVEFHGQM